MKKMINATLVITTVLFSSYGFGYGTTTKLLQAQNLTCELKDPNGLQSTITLTRSLFERSRKQVAFERRMTIDLVEQTKTLANALVIEFNNFQEDRYAANEKAGLYDNGTLFVNQAQSGLALDTQFAPFSTEKISINAKGLELALKYQIGFHSYATSVPVAFEIELQQISASKLKINMDLYYTLNSLDVLNKSSQEEVELSGICTLN